LLQELHPAHIGFKQRCCALLASQDEAQFLNLCSVWETSTNRVLVKQEYNDIQRLFDEAQFCNSAFQTWVWSWIAGGPSFEDFRQKHLPKNLPPGGVSSMSRLYYDQPDCSQCWLHVFISFNASAISRDQQAESLARVRHLLSKHASSFPSSSDQRGIAASGPRYFSAKILAKSTTTGATVSEVNFPAESSRDLSALCWALSTSGTSRCNNLDEKCALILYRESFLAIMQKLSLPDVDGSLTLANSRVSLHIQISPILSTDRCNSANDKRISHIIVLGGSPHDVEGNTEQLPQRMSSASISAQAQQHFSAVDECGRLLRAADVRWTVLAWNQINVCASVMPQPLNAVDEETDFCHYFDLALTNAVTTTLFNAQWYGQQYQIDAVPVSDEDQFIKLDDALRRVAPVRIAVEHPPGTHKRGPIKQVSRTLSKVNAAACTACSVVTSR
jgi:hypothetical protein